MAGLAWAWGGGEVGGAEAAPRPTAICVGLDDNYPPFTFRGADGVLQGILIDQWRLWEQKTGIKVELQAKDWGRALQEMRAGKFDVLDTAFATSERREFLEFGRPYQKIDVPIFFAREIAGIAGIDSLQGFAVGVKAGDADVELLRQHGVDTLLAFDSYEAVVRAAQERKITVFVIDQPPALYFLNKLGLGAEFRHSAPLMVGEFHRTVAKGQTGLLQVVEDGFAQITPAERQAIQDRWYGVNELSPRAWRELRWLLVALGGIVAALFLWNTALRAAVRRHTAELQKSEARLADAQQRTQLGCWEVDLATRQAWWSREMYRLLDCPPQDGVPHFRAWWRRVQREDRARLATAFRQMLAQAGPVSVDFRSAPVAGVVRHFRFVGETLRGAEPRENKAVGTLFDITERKQAEQALLASERKFGDLVGSLPHGVYQIRVSPQGWVFEYVSARWCELTGLTSEAVLADSRLAFDLVHPAEAAEFLARNQAVMQTLEPLIWEGRMIVGGQVRWMHLESRPARPDNGRVLWTGILSDVTDQVRARETARESDARFRRLHESMSDAFVRVDMHGAIQEANTTYAALLGYTAAELQHLSLRDVTPANWQAREAEMLQTQLLVQGHSPVYELEYRCKDGRVVPVELRSFLLRDEAGTPNGWWAIVRDITQRRAIEAALRENEARYRLLFEHNPAPMLIYARDSLQLLAVNDAFEKHYGYSRAEALALRLPDLYPAEEKEPIVALARRLHGHAYAGQWHHLRRDGTLLAIVARSHELKFSDQEARIAVITDITDRQQAEDEVRQLNATLEQRIKERTAELEAKNKELESFTYSVSHDLKAPLRGIDGYSRLLLEDHAAQLDEEGRRFLATVRRAAGQMGQLIDDLLAYSRLERRAWQTESVDLPALIDALLVQRREEIAAAGVLVQVELAVTRVHCDADGLCLALRNLLDNALKFSRGATPPRLEIASRAGGLGTLLTVRDNGVGFDMKFHDRIYDIFQRLHRAEDYPGTGIGLAIVRKAMQRMAGRTYAESCPGQGATFYLEIPHTS